MGSGDALRLLCRALMCVVPSRRVILQTNGIQYIGATQGRTSPSSSFRSVMCTLSNERSRSRRRPRWSELTAAFLEKNTLPPLRSPPNGATPSIEWSRKNSYRRKHARTIPGRFTKGTRNGLQNTPHRHTSISNACSIWVRDDDRKKLFESRQRSPLPPPGHGTAKTSLAAYASAAAMRWPTWINLAARGFSGWRSAWPKFVPVKAEESWADPGLLQDIHLNLYSASQIACTFRA